jgi:redox-sensing transcriptional repressor
LNFAPVTLTAPEGVDVRQVDLSVELQVLAFLDKQRGAVPGAPLGTALAAGGMA